MSAADTLPLAVGGEFPLESANKIRLPPLPRHRWRQIPPGVECLEVN
jgi:hypothetical protein